MSAAGGGGGTNANNILILGLLVLGAVLAGGYYFVEKKKLSERQATVAERKETADKLEKVIQEVAKFQKDKDNLQKRIDLINQLKQNQRGPVRIMDQVSRDLPDLVWLDRMSITGQRISLSGRGLNPNAVANFVENIKNDPYFEEPELGALTEASAVPLVYTFDMNFGFTYTPKAKPGQEGGTPPGTAGTTSTGGTAAPGGAKP